ncbi:MAG: 2-amino-4-hydroxy-6-hydroxymethyldihydropteridine diphosphokinase [Acidobacteriota bacterium]
MMTSEVYLSLGSNLGKREAHLTRALEKLQEARTTLIQISSLYETEPVDLPDQPDFLNLICQVTTDLAPLQLLGTCQQIESDMLRLRERIKGPRNIDIDIILYAHQIVDLPGLTIPHPHWSRRNFVLIPLQEIAPNLRDPVTGKSLQELLRLCPDPAQVTLVTTGQLLHLTSSPDSTGRDMRESAEKFK